MSGQDSGMNIVLPGVHDSLLTRAGGVRVKLRWEMADLCGMLRIIWPEAVSQMWSPPGNNKLSLAYTR